MSYQPPGTLGVLRILAWNSLMRLFRAADVQKSKRQKEAAEGQPQRRQATKRKSGSGMMWLLVLMMPLFLMQASFMCFQAATNITEAAHVGATDDGQLILPKDVRRKIRFQSTMSERDFREILDNLEVTEESRPPRSQVLEAFRERGFGAFKGPPGLHLRQFVRGNGVEWASDDARRTFAKCVVVLILLLAGMALCSAFGAANVGLSGGDWVQWWLMTFPVPTRSLVLARALEYSLVQFFPWFTLFPLTSIALMALGEPMWLGILIGLGGTLATTFLSGTVRLWGETRLRMLFSLHTLKNVQGVCTLLSLSLMALAFWMGLSPSTPQMFLEIGRALPDWVTLLPGAWPVGLQVYGGLAAALGVGVSVVAFAFSIAATSRALRGGVMRTSGVDAGKRGKGRGWQALPSLGLAGKELALLKRDRTFLVQTILVPMFIIVLQLIINPALGKAKGVGIALIAYVVGFYGATGGCFQVLSSEGRALWMLYSLPVSAEEMLRRKTRIWALVCCVFGAGALTVFAGRGGFDAATFATDLVFVLLGVWCAAHIAAAISVMGANTTADSVQRQPKQRYAWLFLFLAGQYSVVLALPELSHRIAGAMVFVTVAYAMWRRACDRMRWLLDPVSDDRSRIDLLDGAAAMLAFFLAQALGGVIVAKFSHVTMEGVAWVFAISGAVALVLSWIRYLARSVPVVAELDLAAKLRRVAATCAIGAAAGAALGGLGLLYLTVIAERTFVEMPVVPPGDKRALLWLGIVAAPIVEELLFRGLVLAGLRRAAPVAVAILWSSLLFAFVHPWVSWPPVFLVGIACGYLRHYGRFLPACMVLHAVYNAIVLGLR